MKRSREEIEEIVKRLGYYLLDEYRSKNNRWVIIRDSSGYKYNTRLSHLIDKHVPYFVGKNNTFSLENISHWLKRKNKPFILCKNNSFNGASKKLFFQCLKPECREVFDMRWNNVFNGEGCPFCIGQRVGNHNNLAYLRPDLAREWDYSKNKHSPKEYTTGNGESVFWICSKCKHSWNTKILHRTQGSGCPKCNQSRGEKKIHDFLIKNNIKFKIEFPLEGCRYKGQLYLDFYLLDHKKGIEYNGEQHYKPVKFSYSMSEEEIKNNLNIQKIKDGIKEKYCKKSNIPLLVIPYWDFDDIEKVISEYIS